MRSGHELARLGLSAQGAARVIMAVPVGPPGSAAALRDIDAAIFRTREGLCNAGDAYFCR